VKPIEPTPPGFSPVLDSMREHVLPLTREVRLDLTFPEGAPDPVPPELEEMILRELK
jgi:hypothetical protein